MQPTPQHDLRHMLGLGSPQQEQRGQLIVVQTASCCGVVRPLLDTCVVCTAHASWLPWLRLRRNRDSCRSVWFESLRAMLQALQAGKELQRNLAADNAGFVYVWKVWCSSVTPHQMVCGDLAAWCAQPASLIVYAARICCC